MTRRIERSLRASAAGVVALVLSFASLRPRAELLALTVRRHWPEAWFCGLIVWYFDFLAFGVSLVLAVVIGRYSFRER
jgi:hypothetical protein